VAEAQWGGLVGFASRTGEAIAKVVNRFDAQSKPTPRKKVLVETSP
jgi:hypothetical protein